MHVGPAEVTVTDTQAWTCVVYHRSHTLQHGTAAFDVSANSPKLNMQLSCNLVGPTPTLSRGLASVPMNLVHLLSHIISQSLNL